MLMEEIKRCCALLRCTRARARPWPAGLHRWSDVYTLPAVALNIRNAEANRLAAEVTSLAGETKTATVILALKERLLRLQR